MIETRLRRRRLRLSRTAGFAAFAPAGAQVATFRRRGSNPIGRHMSISPSISLPPTPKALLDLIKLEAGPAASARFAGWRCGSASPPMSLTRGRRPIGDRRNSPLGRLRPGERRSAGRGDLRRAARSPERATASSRRSSPSPPRARSSASSPSCCRSSSAQIFPPPMPAVKLVGFVLFPLVLWKFTVFLWIYRHADRCASSRPSRSRRSISASCC